MNDIQDMTVFDAHFVHPFIFIVAGPTMVGKTHFVNELIENRDKLITTPPQNIVWFYGERTKLIEKSEQNSIYHFVEGIPPDYSAYIHPTKPNLFVFDDLMLEISKNEQMVDLITKKAHHKNISIILILQDIFYKGSERKTLLRNAQYITLFCNPLDLSGVYSLGFRIAPKRISKFINLFEAITSKRYGYLVIDGKSTTPLGARFRTDIFKPYQRAFRLT